MPSTKLRLEHHSSYVTATLGYCPRLAAVLSHGCVRLDATHVFRAAAAGWLCKSTCPHFVQLCFCRHSHPTSDQPLSADGPFGDMKMPPGMNGSFNGSGPGGDMPSGKFPGGFPEGGPGGQGGFPGPGREGQHLLRSRELVRGFERLPLLFEHAAGLLWVFAVLAVRWGCRCSRRQQGVQWS